MLVGATGAGALSAALFLAFKSDIQEKTKFMSFSALLFPVMLFVFSFTKVFYLSIGILIVIGWSLVSFFALANTYIQLSVPDNLRGRAMSVYTFVFLGTAPIGNAIVGTIAGSLGTTKTVGIAAIICLIASILFSMKMLKGSDIVLKISK
jgi:predicted MFS family arabinose efflux permease